MKLKHFLILLISLSTLFACEKDGNGDNDSSLLVGSWVSTSEYWKYTVDGKVQEGTDAHTDIDDQIRATFNADGTCYSEEYDTDEKVWEKDHMKYTVNGDQLKIISEGDTEIFTFSVNNNNLKLSSKGVEEGVSYESVITFKRR